MIDGLARNHPVVQDGAFYVHLGTLNTGVEGGAVGNFEIKFEEDFYLGADVGFFGLFERINGPAAGADAVDDFVERATLFCRQKADLLTRLLQQSDYS